MPDCVAGDLRQLLRGVVGEQRHTARRLCPFEPGDGSRPVGAGLRVGPVEGGGEDPVAGVVEVAAAVERPVRARPRGARPGGCGRRSRARPRSAAAAPPRSIPAIPALEIAAAERSGSNLVPSNLLSVQVAAGTAPRESTAAAIRRRCEWSLFPNSHFHARSSGPADPPETLGLARLGQAEGEAVERSQQALVVLGARRVRQGSRHPRDRGAADALAPGQGEVAVHVVPVHGEDVLAQPGPGVGHLQLGLPEPGGDPLGGPRLRGVAGLESEWLGRHPPGEGRAGGRRAGGRGFRPASGPGPRRAPRPALRRRGAPPPAPRPSAGRASRSCRRGARRARRRRSPRAGSAARIGPGARPRASCFPGGGRR